jgi:DNA-directed RNA polymerase subunit N (RpoN/RPB10)
VPTPDLDLDQDPPEPRTRIVRNAVRCRLCGDEIESTYRWDYRPCSCGAVAVDGGHDYLRRVLNPPAGVTSDQVYENLSVEEPLQ